MSVFLGKTNITTKNTDKITLKYLFTHNLSYAMIAWSVQFCSHIDVVIEKIRGSKENHE
jgi:hypothetical protein